MNSPQTKLAQLIEAVHVGKPVHDYQDTLYILPLPSGMSLYVSPEDMEKMKDREWDMFLDEMRALSAGIGG